MPDQQTAGATPSRGQRNVGGPQRRSGHLVTANDVRALLGVLSGEQNTSKGIVTTTSDFGPRIYSDPFIKPFMPYRLELINGTALLERLKTFLD